MSIKCKGHEQRCYFVLLFAPSLFGVFFWSSKSFFEPGEREKEEKKNRKKESERKRGCVFFCTSLCSFLFSSFCSSVC